MKRNAAALAKVASTLYGPSWQGALGQALGVDTRTIRRWMNGDFNIPEGVWADLATHCKMQADELLDLSEKLRE